MNYREVYFVLRHYDPTFEQWSEEAQREYIETVLKAWRGEW